MEFDIWEEIYNAGEILSHSFNKKNAFFKIDTGNYEEGSIGIFLHASEKIAMSPIPDPFIELNNEDSIPIVKEAIEKTIIHFDNEHNNKFKLSDIRNYLSISINNNSQIQILENKNKETPVDTLLNPELETAEKAGHVQGVCECVAILGDNHDLAKKLMTETGVTKDIAKKYANPETYKALEQGIFAPKQEQQLERTQGVKR